MEMKEHVSYLKKSLWFIVLFGVVVGAISFAVAQQRKAMYQVVQSYQIDLVNRPVTLDYQYGSYYDLKGVELYTQYVMSLLRSPSVIQDIYKTANLPTTIEDISQFTNQFRTDEVASQHFSVIYSRYTAEEGEQLSTAMTTVLTTAVANGAKDNDNKSLFALEAYPPVIVFVPINVPFLTAVATLAGWLLALVLVYLKRYLKN